MKSWLLITFLSLSVAASSERTCLIPANQLGVPGEGTVIIDILKRTVTQDGKTQTCERAPFSSELVKELLQEHKAMNDLAVQRKQATQAQADQDFEELKSELATLEGSILLKCVQGRQERNYFVSTTNRPSHYGYTGETSNREMFDGLVSEMTCR